MTSQLINIRAAGAADAEWLAAEVIREFCSTRIFTAYRIFDTRKLPALIAVRGGCRCGLAHYRVDGEECELVAFLTTERRVGVGTALLNAIERLAREHECRRLFLTTSNDNLNALAFYQKRRFRLAKLYPGAMDEARRLIPGTPEIGEHGIPLRDDIELDMAL